MSWETIEGNWTQFRRQVRQKWGELTDDDLDHTRGRRTFPGALELPLRVAAVSLLALAVQPLPLAAQQDARPQLYQELDAIATDRAQALNRAYYDYEQALEDLRERAERRDAPSVLSEGRPALRRELETRVLRIERRYERRRADILEKHIGRRFEGGEVADRFGQRAPADEAYADDESLDEPPIEDRTEMARLNEELASTWAQFNEEARELRARVRQDEDWEGYEEAITRLEREYRERITDIQRRQRLLLFEMAREPGPTKGGTQDSRDESELD